MSHIATSKTNFTDRTMLQAAIMDLVLTKDMEPITSEHFLEGTATDRNNTKIDSEFYISRNVLGTYYGDIGFRKDSEGVYELIADAGYDRLYTVDSEEQMNIKEFQKRLNARYAAQKIEATFPQLEMEGRTIERLILEDGTVQITVSNAAYAI